MQYPIRIMDCFLIYDDGTRVSLGEGFVFCNNYFINIYEVGNYHPIKIIPSGNSVRAYFLNANPENNLELLNERKGDIEGKDKCGNYVKLESVSCIKCNTDLFGTSSNLKFQALQFKKEYCSN